MKTLKKIFVLLPVLFLLLSSFTSSAQAPADSLKTTVKDWIEQRAFEFIAQTATPTGRGSRQLTSEYSLTVSGDTITSFLPYFGRSFSAPVNPTDGGIKFTSTRPEVSISPRKKTGWDIVIKPADVPGGYQLRLIAFPSGSATLQVTSSNRQPISFNGRIREIEHRQIGKE